MKITKKEINERIKSILSKSYHENEKVIFKDIINENCIKCSYEVIATFKTVDDIGTIREYYIFNVRNEYDRFIVYQYSLTMRIESQIEIK